MHTEVQDLFKELCGKLDALSHFHYTPKPTIAEAHVKATAPALSMEEATPAAVSDATLIAPRELYSAPRNLKDTDELTKQENSAHRRHRKEVAKKKKQNTAPSTAPVSTQDALKQLKKDKNVTVISPTAPTERISSTKFFKKIQDQPDIPKKPANLTVNSKSYKL
jgi:U3 small nucleolar ribonucleoprotein component